MSDRIRWGILGTGNIATVFARALTASSTGRLVAVASRNRASADAFATQFGISRAYDSYDALLTDPDVDAVYISTPHPLHRRWAVAAADAKKHVLCEKPLGMNAAEARAMIDAARRNDVFLMEAFMYRCHPQIAQLIELIRGGAIGEVRAVSAAFSFMAPNPDPNGRLLNKALGGGGILDVGCYPVSFSRLVAGVAMGLNAPAEPVELKGVARLGPTGVDEWAAAVMRFPNDVIAQVSAGLLLEQENAARVYGTKGNLFLPTPWVPREEVRLTLTRAGRAPEDILIRSRHNAYTLEADVVGARLAARQAPFPAMSWDDTLGNVRALDAWRREVGLRYEGEQEHLSRAGDQAIEESLTTGE
jgi:predicted dehydrogenase